MWEQKQLGTVKEVFETTVIVLLDREITNMTKKIGERIYYIGQIGSYVLIPIGAIYVIGIVAAIKKEELRDNGVNFVQYLMTVTLVGTIRKGRYETGVSVMPTVDMMVYLLEDKDIKGIFAAYQQYNFSIGQLSLFENERAYLDPNRFFGKHLAVLGSSGAGKSYTVASILQKIARFTDTHVILLDLHNEYRQAFPDTGQFCEIASLELPYWLMNAEEMLEMFVDATDSNASLQGAVLQDLIYMAKKSKNPTLADVLTIDSPVAYDLKEIRSKLHFMDTEKIPSAGGMKEGPYFGKFSRLLIRLDSKMNDPRYAFLFQPNICVETESVMPLLMTLFGLASKSKITIWDMSGVPFDVVKTISALISRITFDFNFWNPKRADLPILIVFEEAHNYLSVSNDGSKAARRTVERIAKEGRKYGVSCMIVSQRPSDISETILSQCNNFIILRLLNPTDQAYISRLVPDNFTGLNSVVPLLRQGEAVIVGDAIPIPQRVQIDFPQPAPQSSDVKFFDKWKQPSVKTDVSEVMEHWWNQKRS
jgi:uncharacterized protein